MYLVRVTCGWPCITAWNWQQQSCCRTVPYQLGVIRGHMDQGQTRFLYCCETDLISYFWLSAVFFVNFMYLGNVDRKARRLTFKQAFLPNFFCYFLSIDHTLWVARLPPWSSIHSVEVHAFHLLILPEAFMHWGCIFLLCLTGGWGWGALWMSSVCKRNDL